MKLRQIFVLVFLCGARRILKDATVHTAVRFQGNRVKQKLAGGQKLGKAPTQAEEQRDPCTNVSLLDTPRNLIPGFWEWSNPNKSVHIDIQPLGTRAWEIESRNHTVTLPSVHIHYVDVDCVLKGLCADLVTTAINHWRFQIQDLKPEADFAVGLHFLAHPSVAGCKCYMSAMMGGHSRTQLYVRMKADFKVSTHEGFVTNTGEELQLPEELHLPCYTIARLVDACLTQIDRCQGFAIKQSPPKDPETECIDEFHFKSAMSFEDLVPDESGVWTSYRVERVPKPPYELQYAPRDGHHWYREWCEKAFESSASLLAKDWLFL